MQALGYYLLLPVLYLISVLPGFLFYGLSDLLYLLIYRLLGYRKRVVLTNLRNAFPEKSEAEINRISADFYHFLCDVTLETFKALTISEKELVRRCRFSDEAARVFGKYPDKQQSIVIVMGHFGNWEWAGSAFSVQARQKAFTLYHPLSNPYFDQLMNRIRTRFGLGLVPMQEAYRAMVKNKDIVTSMAFIADQTPSSVSGAYWTRFLNQDTPVLLGTETLARKMNYPVVYASVVRVSRGFYEIQAETLTDDPSKTAPGEITEMHTRRLEKDIIRMPATWLWSHRRWKHKREGKR